MPLDLPPPPKLWLPPKPAIVRAADAAPVLAARRAGHAHRRAAFPMPAFVPAIAPRELTLEGTFGVDSSGKVHSFPGVGFGAEHYSRYLFALTFTHGSTSGYTTTCTIGGAAATALKTVISTAGSFYVRTTIWGVALPAGTTGTVELTHSTSCNRSGGKMLRAINLNSVAVYGSGSDVHTSTSDTQLAWTMDVPAGGIGIGLVSVANVAAAHAWSGLTEWWEGDVAGGNGLSVAVDLDMASETARAIVVTTTDTWYGAGCSISIAG